MKGIKVFPSLNDLREMRYFDENPGESAWTEHERHFFIITDGSRPVYCRYGNELNVTPLLCTIVAFTGQLKRDGDQKLQTIVAGNKQFVFYLPSPFIYVCVCSIKLPPSLLYKELQILEGVIFSLLTPNIAQQLIRKPNFDIKKQTASAERLFTSALLTMDTSPNFVFNDCVPKCAIQNIRDQFFKVTFEKRQPCVYAAVFFYQGDAFLIVEHEDFHLSPDDIMILQNNTYPSTESLGSAWTPICLPSHVNMLHILTVDLTSCNFKLILISDQIDACPGCTKMAEEISAALVELKLSEKMAPLEPLQDPGILHWIIANRPSEQVYSPYIEPSNLCSRIYKGYAWIYEYLKNSNHVGPFYAATEEITLYGYHRNEETLISASAVGTSASEAATHLDKLAAYVNANRRVFFDNNTKKWE